jgi:hypothetical protein
MTGTLREYGGSGLALLAKRATLVNAAKRGFELVSTENNETNGPMLRADDPARPTFDSHSKHEAP